MASSELARPEVPNFVDLLRSFPGQARLALGTRGVLWATFAGVVGVVCCVVAFAAIGLSLHRSDVDPERRKARDVLTLDNASRLLMRSILALHRPQAGRIRVLGRDALSFDPGSRRFIERNTGVLFQNGALFSALNVFENIAFPLRESGWLDVAQSIPKFKKALMKKKT